MKKLLSTLAIATTLLGLPVAAGAATTTTIATTAVFDGTYSTHGTLFGTASGCANPPPNIDQQVAGNVAVVNGTIRGDALHFTFSDHKDASVSVTKSADGITFTYKYNFSLTYGGASFIETGSAHGVVDGCTFSYHATGRGIRISK